MPMESYISGASHENNIAATITLDLWMFLTMFSRLMLLTVDQLILGFFSGLVTIIDNQSGRISVFGTDTFAVKITITIIGLVLFSSTTFIC